MDLQQTTIHLPPFLHGEVRRQAALRGISMSELARQAFIGFLRLGPVEMVEAMAHLEGGGSSEEWAELPGFAVAGLADAYRLVDGLLQLDLSAARKTEITFAWMRAPMKTMEEWRDCATLFAAATLTDPKRTNELIVDHVSREMSEGVHRPDVRVAGLLERTATPPLDELLDMTGQGGAPGVLPIYYATHICGRNLVEPYRDRLVDLVHTMMAADSDTAVVAGLELATVLRAGELVDAVSIVTLAEGDAQRRAIVALGAIASAQPSVTTEADEQFSADKGSSYYRIPIDRRLPVPAWQQWSVPDAQREYALGLLIERLESGQLDARSAALALGGIARSEHGEAERYLVELVEQTDRRQKPVPTEPLVNALAHFDTTDAQGALEKLSHTGNTAVRKAALKALFSRKPGPEPLVGAGEPMQFATHAAVLRWADMSGVSWPLHEVQLNAVVAPLCEDYATVRRWMIGLDLFNRENSTYEPTELGQLVTRVERWLESSGVRGARRKELLR